MPVPLNYHVNKRSLDVLLLWLGGGALAMLLGRYVSEQLVLPVLALSGIASVVWGRKRVRDEEERLRACARAEAERHDPGKAAS